MAVDPPPRSVAPLHARFPPPSDDERACDGDDEEEEEVAKAADDDDDDADLDFAFEIMSVRKSKERAPCVSTAPATSLSWIVRRFFPFQNSHERCEISRTKIALAIERMHGTSAVTMRMRSLCFAMRFSRVSGKAWPPDVLVSKLSTSVAIFFQNSGSSSEEREAPVCAAAASLLDGAAEAEAEANAGTEAEAARS